MPGSAYACRSQLVHGSHDQVIPTTKQGQEGPAEVARQRNVDVLNWVSFSGHARGKYANTVDSVYTETLLDLKAAWGVWMDVDGYS